MFCQLASFCIATVVVIERGRLQGCSPAALVGAVTEPDSKDIAASRRKVREPNSAKALGAVPLKTIEDRSSCL